MLRRIGAEEGGEFKAVASGTLPSGRPVVVNADGTVSVVEINSATAAIGSESVFESATMSNISSTFDSSNNKVVISYKDAGNGGHGTAVVGTVTASDNSISFGTPVVFNAASTSRTAITFDSSNNKVVIGYADNGDSDKGKAIVGTVSGTSISFGSAQQFTSSSDSVNADFAASFDSSANKVVFSWRNNSGGTKTGKSIVGTVSGTSISFGTAATFESGAADKISAAYDANADRTVVLYRDDGNSNYTSVAVGTISGTSISFGTPVVITSSAMSGDSTAIAYDSTNQKLALFYSRSSEGKVAVGVVSGTSITITERPTYGFESGNAYSLSAVYDANANLVVVAYRDPQDSNKGKIALPRISGTDILDPNDTMPNAGGHGTPIVFEAGVITQPTTVVYDSNAKKVVVSYTDDNNSEHGTSRVVQNAYSNPNLTSENYIGMSRGVVDVTSVSETLGSETVFESAFALPRASTFDSSNNKVVIAYQDADNSNYGTAIVGTVSGTSISFGSPVVFNSGSVGTMAATFDSNSNKVVIAFTDNQDAAGESVVGTVSGTSISFGSEVQFESFSIDFPSVTFDSNLNKVVIVYRDAGNLTHGKSIVGTVSGTSISYGSAVTFESASTYYPSIVYDSNSEKVVIAYQDSGNSSKGTAIVGTVSGTSISFGSTVLFEDANVEELGAAYDSTSQKVVIAYRDAGNSSYGTAIVGTVSGTSISFGSASVFESADSRNIFVTFDSNADKVIIAYKDQGNSGYGTFVVGTVSGTSISFETPTVFNSGSTSAITSTYDANAQKVVISYTDYGNSTYGTAIVLQPGYTSITRAEVTNSGNASVDIIGSVSTNQSSLTAGQQYFVQTDGTISTTAGSPSVLAGTAISATELVVKT